MNATTLIQSLRQLHPGTAFVLMLAAALFLGVNIAPQAQPSLETMLQFRQQYNEDIFSLINKGSSTRFGWPCKVVETYTPTSTQMIVNGVPTKTVESTWPSEWHIGGTLLNLAIGAIALLLLGITMEFAFYLQTRNLPEAASSDSLTTAM
jgi:hypothetical protein